MPRTRKEEDPIVDDPVVDGRLVELGPYTVGFESFRESADPALFFAGLPDDRRQCPHWGVVRSVKLAIRYSEWEELYAASDAYYVTPGHLPLVFAGTEIVEFSPTETFQQTVDVIGANLAAMSG